MSFEQYVAWYLQYIQLHVQLAGQMGKPLILEEFNTENRQVPPPAYTLTSPHLPHKS